MLLVALLASACAGGDDSATETVTVTTATTVTVTETTTETTTTQGPSGTLPVDAFNARAESVDEPWERDLAEVTNRFLALREQEGGAQLRAHLHAPRRRDLEGRIGPVDAALP